MDIPVLYEIDATKDFDKEVERFVRKKKFRKLPAQIAELSLELSQGKFDGTPIKEASNPIEYVEYKLRMPNEDTKSGKSNGYRVIYAVMQEEKLVLLVMIYYKKEKETLPQEYIDGLIFGYLLAQSDAEEED